MKTFRLSLGATAYVMRGSLEKRLTQNTDYVIFAKQKDTALSILKEFVGDTYTHSSPRVQGVELKELASALEEITDHPRFERIAKLIAETEPFTGSINIEGTLLVMPDSEHDLFVMKCSEGSKVRVILETSFIHEDDSFSLGDDEDALNFASLSRLVQSEFL